MPPSAILNPCQPTPASGKGGTQTFVFSFYDGNGWQDFDVVNVLINSSLNGQGACYLAYSRSVGVLYLENDAGSGLLPGLVLNGSGSTANSQCTISGAGSSVTGSGNILTLTLNITFATGNPGSAFAGNKVIYMAARDVAADNSGWQTLGSWAVPSIGSPSPGAVSVSPAAGSGQTQTFSFTFSDSPTYQSLNVVDALINATLDGRSACYIAYSLPSNVAYLVDNDGSTLLPGIQPGSTGSDHNSQCTISGIQVANSGTQLTLTVNIGFTAAFAGNKVAYLAARDVNGVNSQWQTLGTWSVTNPTQNQTTITTSPTGLSVVVDGVPCSSSCTYLWTPNTPHVITATPRQTSGSTPYYFSNWSDGLPFSRLVTAPSAPTSYTATFAAGVSVYGGVSPSALEVNLGDLPFDAYDAGTLNAKGSDTTCQPGSDCYFYRCPGLGNWTVPACMENLLSAYAIQGVTGVRFMFNTLGAPSTAFDSNKNIRSTWVNTVASFFSDLAAFGITNITPTPAWDDYGAALSGPTCAAYQAGQACSQLTSNCTVAGTGAPGKSLNFSPLLPYGNDPNDQNNPDGYLNEGNNAWACSPTNPNFWGWNKHEALIDSIAGAAKAAGLNIEEFDIQNEVSLNNYPVQARLIYDNTQPVGAPGTPVLQTLGQILANHGYSSSALTVSVDTDTPGSFTPSPPASYPCASIYGDAAQLLGTSELLGATGGARIGGPPQVAVNGAMSCDTSAQNCSPGDTNCIFGNMFSMPTQGTPTVTDMHNKPCMSPDGPCDTSQDATIAARDTFSAIQTYLGVRSLTNNLVIFGETWSNSNEACNGYPDATLTRQMISGYSQSCLYSSSNSGCTATPKPGNVVFRPWGNDEYNGSLCETPLNVGAPNGPFKQ